MTTLVSGLSAPTAMDFAPDGRLFVLEQGGDVDYVRPDGSTWTALHLNVDSQDERGLLGIAFDPNFATNHYVYLYYTNPNPGAAPWAGGEHNQLSRFTVNDTNPQQPVLTNEAPILDWNSLSSAQNHNGGAIHFGLDGMLYADAGDNVQTFTLNGNTYRVSQTLSNLLGKQLRINVEAFNNGTARRDDTTVGHLIPADNPFVGKATGINQLIYALGLRNPFTFAVQPKTGIIYINDVGENTWEEIDQSIAGANYGWSGGNTDGFGQTPPGPGVYHEPLLAYNHSGGPAGGGIAIVGGTFYDPATNQFPSSYVGKYFYADLGAGWIRVFDPAKPGNAANPDTSAGFATDMPGGSRDLLVDSAGDLLYLSGDGSVYVIAYKAPKITKQPAGTTVNTSQSATFTVTATGPSLQYQWQHFVSGSWTNVAGTTNTLTLENVAPADAGNYRVIVSNTFGSVTSTSASLTVNANVPPAIVTQPVDRQVDVGQNATFTVVTNGAIPLNFEWQHLAGNTWQDVGTSSATLTITAATSADAGSYRVIVSNSLGSQTSDVATLSVSPLPTATITLPATGTRFNWGQTITFAGSGRDGQGSALAASQESWQVVLFEENAPTGAGLRSRTFQTFNGVNGGSFVANAPDTTPLLWYRIILTVTDANGGKASQSVDVHANTVTFLLNTQPPGLAMFLDSRPVASGTQVTGITGQPHQLSVPAVQTVGGTTYTFTSWSNGGAATHTIAPLVSKTFTARYIATLAPGLRAEFFTNPANLRALPNLTGRAPTVARIDSQIAYPLSRGPWPGLSAQFAGRFTSLHTGFLEVNTPGRYTLTLMSKDGSKLWLDGSLLINNDGIHAQRARSATVTLSAGLHALQVEYFDNTGGGALVLSWSGPGFARQVIPAGNLFYNPSIPVSSIVAPQVAHIRSLSRRK